MDVNMPLLSQVQITSKIKLVWEWPVFFSVKPQSKDYIVGVEEKYKLVNLCCLDIELLSSKLNKLCMFGRTIMQRQRCQEDIIKLWITKQRCDMENPYQLWAILFGLLMNISVRFLTNTVEENFIGSSAVFLSLLPWNNTTFLNASISVYVVFPLRYICFHLWKSCLFFILSLMSCSLLQCIMYYI